MELFTIKNLSFRYRGAATNAIENISFAIHEAEFLTIFGETGCGKTTLLKLLKKQLSPFGEKKGEIFFQGIALDDLDERSSAFEIGFVMQNPDHQIVTDKVWHELAFGLESLGLGATEIKKRVAEISSFFGITDWYHRNTSELSGGQKQLLNLAAIMVMRPNILILDEPTAQLDPIAASEFIHILKKINQELGTSILIVDHRLEEIIPISDRVLLMNDKAIQCLTTPLELAAKMKELKNERMSLALPSSIRIFYNLEDEAKCPITVKEGIQYLKKYRADKSILAEEPSFDDTREKVFEIKEGFFRYERNTADILNGLDLDVYFAEFLVIVGDNGVGKSTLLKIMSGVRKLYHGKLRIWGKKLKEYSKTELYRNQLSLLPQNPQSIFVKNNVKDELYDAYKIMGITKEKRDEEIYEIVEFLEIEKLLTQHPYDLSGGEQQKVALAKILLMKPRVLLLDEPTKGMDAYAKTLFAKMLKDLQTKGVTIVMVSHDIEFAASYADRVGMYFDGQIVAIDNPVQLFKNNQYYTTAAYRISRLQYDDATTVERVVKLCKLNGLKDE